MKEWQIKVLTMIYFEPEMNQMTTEKTILHLYSLKSVLVSPQDKLQMALKILTADACSTALISDT